MPEPLRILLRLTGLVLFAGSLAGVLFIVSVGPDEVAGQMGRECRHNNQLGPADQCHWQDVLGILGALPYVCLVGAVLIFAMHPDWVGPGRPERQGPPRSGPDGSLRWKVESFSLIAVVLVVVVNFAGVFVYKAGYTAVTVATVAKEVHENRPKKPERPRTVAEHRAAIERRAAAERRSAAKAPRGLARGSLLRAPAFRRAMSEIRRAAPAGARLSGLRVAADRIDAEVLARGRVVSLRKSRNAKVTVESDGPVADGGVPLVTFARLDRRAPQRVATAARRLHRSHVDYLVLQDVVGLQWRAFLKGGAVQVTASPDGRLVQ